MFEVVDPGHLYLVRGDNQHGEHNRIISFIKKEEDKLIRDGIQNIDLYDVLLDRLNYLQEKFPCEENIEQIRAVMSAKNWDELRTTRRMSQGVEGKDLPHEPYVLGHTDEF